MLRIESYHPGCDAADPGGPAELPGPIHSDDRVRLRHSGQAGKVVGPISPGLFAVEMDAGGCTVQFGHNLERIGSAREEGEEG